MNVKSGNVYAVTLYSGMAQASLPGQGLGRDWSCSPWSDSTEPLMLGPCTKDIVLVRNRWGCLNEVSGSTL